MRELYDRLIVEGEEGIDRLVAERTKETVTLDFKEARGASTGILANEDRRTFAKALSAFANSAGGLLVFGVEARKGDDNVDCAQALKPIANIERFETEARTASGQLLQPRHEGIEVRSIPSVRLPGGGYLLVRVERSDRRPHRSEAAGQKQYFKRAGDSSFEMEHYDIEDAFQRIAVPELVVDISRGDYLTSHFAVFSDVNFYLRNVSPVTARNPYFHISGQQRIHPSNDDFAWITRGSADGWTTFSGLTEAVIHPGLRRQFVRSVIQYQIANNDFSQVTSNRGEMFSLRMRWGCENSRMREQELSFRIGDYASPWRSNHFRVHCAAAPSPPP